MAGAIAGQFGIIIVTHFKIASFAGLCKSSAFPPFAILFSIIAAHAAK